MRGLKEIRDLRGPVWLMQPIPYLGEELEKEDWIVEPKIDGWRMQVLKFGDGRVQLSGRRLEKKPNWTEKLPEIGEVTLRILPPGSLIDTELFSSRGRRFIPSLFAQRPKARPIVYVFDLIFWEGRFLGDRPLKHRREILENVSWEEPFRLLPKRPLSSIECALKEALLQGYEGIVIKRLDSSYRIGKGAPEATCSWRKIKGS